MKIENSIEKKNLLFMQEIELVLWKENAEWNLIDEN